MWVIPSNLHSCHAVIDRFRKDVSRDLIASFADLVFPDEKISCIVGRDVKFSLVVDRKGAIGSLVLASSTEPQRTEILFIHSIRDEEEALNVLLKDVLSFLGSKRTPDVKLRRLEGLHLQFLKSILREYEFTESIKDRLTLKIHDLKKTDLSAGKFRVAVTDSLLNWRALYLSATGSKPIEESKRHVQLETPYGTVQQDDLIRLVALDGKTAAGTIGYSICRNTCYVEKLGVLGNHADRTGVARTLLSGAIQIAKRKKCDYVVTDVDNSSPWREVIGQMGFQQVGKISYHSRIVTSRVDLAHREKKEW